MQSNAIIIAPTRGWKLFKTYLLILLLSDSLGALELAPSPRHFHGQELVEHGAQCVDRLQLAGDLLGVALVLTRQHLDVLDTKKEVDTDRP